MFTDEQSQADQVIYVLGERACKGNCFAKEQLEGIAESNGQEAALAISQLAGLYAPILNVIPLESPTQIQILKNGSPC